MIVKTAKQNESLEITKISLNKIYFNLKTDSSFSYDSGKISLYVDDQKIDTLTLTSDNLAKSTTNNGYTGSFNYKNGATIIIKLEDAVYNSNSIDTKLQAKIINY